MRFLKQDDLPTVEFLFTCLNRSPHNTIPDLHVVDGIPIQIEYSYEIRYRSNLRRNERKPTSSRNERRERGRLRGGREISRDSGGSIGKRK
jgi:hypothetical protein